MDCGKIRNLKHMRLEKKIKLRQLRVWRIRKKVVGSSVRPRMAVKFSGTHIYVQFIDDSIGRTLASATTVQKGVKAVKGQANVANAKRIGAAAAEAAKAVGINAVVFDRAGARYHGKIKALADAAREAGLHL